MTTTLRSTLVAALVSVSALVAPSRVPTAQNLGPFRQFLAIEPYYTRLDQPVRSRLNRR